MYRRALLASTVAALLPRDVLSQSGASAFKQLKLAEIARDAGIERELSAQTERDFLFVPPLFRYRLSVRTEGAIESLNDDDVDILKKWGTFVNRPDFVALFRHKALVREDGLSQWLFWQDALVQPFRDELAQGGALLVNALLIGARRQQPLLLAIGFQST